MGIAIYLDSGDLNVIDNFRGKVDGFTTNPSLIAKVGITSYDKFCAAALQLVGGKPISFEILSRENIRRQVDELSGLGDNVWVKIPVTDLTPYYMHHRKINVTGVFTKEQILDACQVADASWILSVFAGRIADTGREPIHLVRFAVERFPGKVLWASAREVFNVRQAEWCGADIITLSPDLIAKLSLFDKDLHQYSLETIEQFYEDAKALQVSAC